jgi:NAD(P)-dependent dehydrogenase (short-subunit alcohol dehydrogenase family)
MTEFRFDGRAAVVTGAGRGIGRAYAVQLAQRGAQVVVNDLDAEPAQEVVDEIHAAGGAAVAQAGDISTPEGGAAAVEAALAAFGRIDVLVNNAGNQIWADLPEIDLATFEKVYRVHVAGSFNTARAAWPHMLEQDYGRIVLTTSIGMLGLRGNLAYASAKSGMLGMAKSMSASARKKNLRINCIAPNATTRMAGGGEAPSSASAQESPWGAFMDPEMVAPMVTYLAHEQCPTTGEVFVAGGGRFAKLFIGSTQGYLAEDPATFSVEDVAAHWDAINDESDYYVPVNPIDWSMHYMSHLGGEQ